MPNSIFKYILFLFLSITLLAQAETHHPQQFLAKISGKKDEGKQIYQHFCANCHAEKALIKLGAPSIGVLADWQKRTANGFDGLILHTYEGLNAMPARGGCFECSDKQLLKTILYMLPQELRDGFIASIKTH